MHALIGLVLLVGTTLTHDEKEAVGFEMCEDVADVSGYDECAVEIAGDEERMWLHYGCARWDPEIEQWRITFDTIVPYRWTDIGVVKLDTPVLVGCPMEL